MIEAVFRRIADIVQIDEALLWMHKSSESLQMVHYGLAQYYNSHHDYETDAPNSRYVTFLMYLNQPEKGGETEFPS